MISHNYKYIFIHVPKCAGTSIEKYLLNLEGIKRPERLSLLPQNIQNQYHLDSGIKGHAFHEEFDITFREKYFSFTFVRNPFDKVASEYNWDPQFKNISFLEFLKTPKNWNIRHVNKQVEFIDKHIDFIGRFENLQEDFETVCDIIEIPRQELPHKNKSKHKHYTEYYDDETKQIVAEQYAKDIEYFGYKFGE